MSSLSVIFSDENLNASQKRMIAFLNSKGVPPKAQAHQLDCDPSYIYHVQRGEKRFPGQDIMLRYMCSAYGDDTFIEEGVAGRKCVSPVPEVTFNGCTQDEVLDGAEAIGRTRFDAVRGDWRAVMAYGWQLISVGWRLVVHAKHMLGQEIPAKKVVLPAPLFEQATA